MLFPPKVIRARIEVTIQNFFEDLKNYCQKMGWRCDKPVFKEKEWYNILIKIEEIEQWDDNRPKAYLFTFYIPSPIAAKGEPNFTNNPPIIGFEHKIYVKLNKEYPIIKARESPVISDNYLYIESRSQIWHPRFFPRKQSWGCIMVFGELDAIAMHLFGQLLWHVDKVWKYKGTETTNNPVASRWGSTNKEKAEQFMKKQMDKMWGVKEKPVKKTKKKPVIL